MKHDDDKHHNTKTATVTQFLLPLQEALAAVHPVQIVPFGLSVANKMAVELLSTWETRLTDSEKSVRALGMIITGPRACGKSYLASRVAERLAAQWLTGRALNDQAEIDRHAPAIVIDDVDKVTDPYNLFRTITACQQSGLPHILTGQGSPRQWSRHEHGVLRDLDTRISAMPEAPLTLPDEELILTALTVHFAARQVILPQAAARLAARKLRRSFHCIMAFFELLDKEALRCRAKIDSAMVQRVLDRHSDLTL